MRKREFPYDYPFYGWAGLNGLVAGAVIWGIWIAVFAYFNGLPLYH